MGLRGRGGSLVGQPDLVTDANLAASLNRGVHADPHAVVLGSGPQDAGVLGQVVLLQGGHHAAHARLRDPEADHVTDGEGLIQSRGDAIHPISAGDTIHTPADEWHWHGARPDHTMTHLTMTEGTPTWGDHVTDAEYRGEASAPQQPS